MEAAGAREGLTAAGQLHGHLKLGGQAGDLAHDHLALLDLGLQGRGLLALAGQAHKAHLLLSEAVLRRKGKGEFLVYLYI